MQLFYNPEINQTTESFSFDREESKHIIKVMRKASGDKLYVTNGLGYLFTTKITLGSENKCLVKIIAAEKVAARSYQLHMAVSPTKMNDRFEWFLEKATEFGVTEITPLICARTEKKTVKTDRMEKIIQSAMKQSLQSYLPKLNEPCNFSDFIRLADPNLRCIAHCEDADKKTLKSMLTPNYNFTILIGPEGDFTPKEIELALANNVMPVSLGHTRLRTETAAIAACHSVVFINQ